MNRHAVVAALVLGLTCAGAFAQQTGHEQHHPGSAAPAKSEMSMDQKCAMMQQKMGAMHEQMKSEHQKVQSLLQEMNTSTGPAKMDAMAAAVNAIAANCDEMHRMESDMMQAMMEHMSEHMAQGGGKDMMMCPMMQDHGMGMSMGGGEHGKTAAPEENPEHQDHSAPAEPTPDGHAGHHPTR